MGVATGAMIDNRDSSLESRSEDPGTGGRKDVFMKGRRSKFLGFSIEYDCSNITLYVFKKYKLC